jgi:hypothetical protein
VEIGRIVVWSQPLAKILQNVMWWDMPVIPATQESTNQRITVQVSLNIKWDPISEITKGWQRGSRNASSDRTPI